MQRPAFRLPWAAVTAALIILVGAPGWAQSVVPASLAALENALTTRDAPALAEQVRAHPDWLGAPVRLGESSGTPLFIATVVRSAAMVNVLLDAGAVTDCCSNWGRSPLGQAAMSGWVEGMAILLGHSADYSQADASGYAPIHFAALANAPAGLRLLHRAGADVDLRSGRGDTALSIAAGSGGHQAMQALVELGAGVNLSDRRGDTALLAATRKDDLIAVDLLLASGAQVNQANRYGVTPLHDAAAFASPKTVRRLRAAGADITVRTAAGLSALDVASRLGRHSLAALLR